MKHLVLLVGAIFLNSATGSAEPSKNFVLDTVLRNVGTVQGEKATYTIPGVITRADGKTLVQDLTIEGKISPDWMVNEKTGFVSHREMQQYAKDKYCTDINGQANFIGALPTAGNPPPAIRVPLKLDTVWKVKSIDIYYLKYNPATGASIHIREPIDC